MQTATEMNAEEAAKRQRAGRYEKLIGRKVRLEKLNNPTKIEAWLTDPAAITALTVEALKQIVDLVSTLPILLTTAGAASSTRGSGDGRVGGLIAGNLIVKDLLEEVAGNALAVAQRKVDERNESIVKFRAELNEVNELLKEFENE